MARRSTDDAGPGSGGGAPGSSAGFWLALAAAERAAEACSADRARSAADDGMGEQLSRQRSELELTKSELEAMYALSGSLGRARDRDELLSNILDAVSDVASLREYTEQAILAVEGESLRVVASRGGFTCSAVRPDRPGVRVGECLCGLAVEKSEIVTSPNSLTDPRYLPAESSGPRAHLIVPLIAMDRVLGVLHLHQPTGEQPDERRLKLLSSVGERIGASLEMARLSEETRDLSLYDSLTGLANRRLLRVALEENAARARRRRHPFSVIALDLDHFDRYADVHGETAGDKLLVDVATLIMRQIREMDLAARYGHQEFLILLPETGLDDAARVAERIRASVIKTSFFHKEAGERASIEPASITVSPGVASCDQASDGEIHVVDMAEKAMLEAKRKGGNRVERYLT